MPPSSVVGRRSGGRGIAQVMQDDTHTGTGSQPAVHGQQPSLRTSKETPPRQGGRRAGGVRRGIGAAGGVARQAWFPVECRLVRGGGEDLTRGHSNQPNSPSAGKQLKTNQKHKQTKSQIKKRKKKQHAISFRKRDHVCANAKER